MKKKSEERASWSEDSRKERKTDGNLKVEEKIHIK